MRSTWNQKVEREGPTAWYKQENPITQALAQDISQDTLIPIDSPGGVNQFKVAARLLEDFRGDLSLIRQALNALRHKKKIERGIELYLLRSILQNHASKLKSSKAREEKKREEFVQDDVIEEMVVCPKCGKRIYAHALNIDCKGH